VPTGKTLDHDNDWFGDRRPVPAGVRSQAADHPRAGAALSASMAVGTEPALDESLVSWVDRTAAAFGVTAGETLRGFGLLGCRSQRVRLYGIVLPDADRRHLAAITGLTTERIGGMLLDRFDGSALDLSRLRHGAPPGQVAVQEGGLFWGTRACPHCLRESGGAWSVWWKLRFAVACSSHRVILVDSCPACGALPRQGRSGSGWPVALSEVPCPAICGHRVAGGSCGFDLAAMEPDGADDRVLNAQARVWDQVAAGDRAWVMAVREAIGLVRRFARPNDLGPMAADAATAFSNEVDRRDGHRPVGRPAGWFNTLPASAAALAAVLPAAVEMVDSDDLDASVRWLVAAAQQTGKGWRCLPERLGWSSVVADRWRAGVRPLLGFSDMGRSCAAGAGIDARHVPQAAPVELWQAVATLVPGTAADTGRTFVALAAVVAIEGCSWPAAGAHLGLAAQESGQIANVVSRRIAEHERFWATIVDVVTTLAANPVDYQTLRKLFEDLTEIDASSWTSMCDRNGISKGKPVRRRYAAGWAWCATTGGLVRRSPSWVAAVERGANPASLREGHVRFVRWLPASVAADLMSWVGLGPNPTMAGWSAPIGAGDRSKTAPRDKQSPTSRTV
jgi:TniQ